MGALALGATAAAAATLPWWDAPDGPRLLGSLTASIHLTQYYSLSCPHSQAFARDTWPLVKAHMIDTGQVRWQWIEACTDQQAIIASAVVRSMDINQYQMVTTALMTNPAAWMLADPTDTSGLWAVVSAHGMAQADFQAALADQGLQEWLKFQEQQSKAARVPGTPTLLFNGNYYPGELSYAQVAQLIST